jgi:hypothetical protein
MRTLRALLAGVGFGASWMYFNDPGQGKRRRALVRDRCGKTLRGTRCWIDKALRDAEHRVQGSMAEFRCMFESGTVSDATLTDRIRAKLGHVASQPKLIEVHCDDGHVMLSGSAPALETAAIVAAIRAVRGVQSVEHHLETDGHHFINGQMRHGRPSWDVLGENWAPSTRLTAGTIGGVLMANCLLRRTPMAILWGTLGFGLAARAVANQGFRQMAEQSKQFAPQVREWANPITSRMRETAEAIRQR